MKPGIAESLALLLLISALTAGCAGQKAYLIFTNVSDSTEPTNRPELVMPEGAELRPDTKIVLPKPVEERVSTNVDAHPDTDFVRFRFDINASGMVLNSEVIHASKEQLAEDAKSILDSWQFEPAFVDGVPAEMRKIEAVMDFYDGDAKTKSAFGKAAAIIVLIPVGLVLGVAPGGSIEFGN